MGGQSLTDRMYLGLKYKTLAFKVYRGMNEDALKVKMSKTVDEALLIFLAVHEFRQQQDDVRKNRD